MKISDLLKELKSTGLVYNLWNSGLLDRIISDYMVSTDLIVESVGTGSKQASVVVSKDRRDKEVTRNVRCKYHDQMPVKLLPNCASYKMKKSKLSWINGLFNLISRTEKSGGLIIGWKNTHRNRFLKYIFNYMGHKRDEGNGEAYWKIGRKLMKTEVYQISSFQATFPSWQLELPGQLVEEVLKELKSIISEEKAVIDYRRVYIEKSNGKLRPLGVPSAAWRVYLHMLNNLIVWWKLGLEPNQHGYLPRRGVITCWKEVIAKLEKSSSVYEFDLKGFFDNVDLKYLEQELCQIGIPEKMVRHVGDLNKSIVRLKEEDKLDESAHRMVIFNSNGSLNPNLPEKVKKELEKLSRAWKELYISNLISEGYKEFREFGVPQGAATSCGLSTLSLKELYNQNMTEMYADDGVIFEATDEPNCTHEEAGVYKEKNKSRWVKFKGQYLTSLKFLGLEYIPPGTTGIGEERAEIYPRLRSNTRNGARIEFDTRLQFLCFLSRKYKECYTSVTSRLSSTLKSLKGKGYINQEELTENRKIAMWLDSEDIKVIDPNLSIEKWIEERWEEFKELSWNDRLNLLFTSEAGPVTLARMYNGSLDLLTVADTRLTYALSSWASKKWPTYLYKIGASAEYRELIKHLLRHKKIVFPEIDLKKLKDSPAFKERLEVYRSLFKLRQDPKAWSFGRISSKIQETKSDFLNLRKLLKWMLRVVRLDLDNSSTFACDDLLNYLSSKGNIKGWSQYGREVQRCKAGFEKRIDRKQHKDEFEAGKEALLKKQRLKLKKELRMLHKELVYGRDNILA